MVTTSTEGSRWRIGLRERTALVFAGLAFALSPVLALVLWTVSSRYADDQVDGSALAQTTDNAALLEAWSSTTGEGWNELLRRVHYPADVTAQLWSGPRGHFTTARDAALPTALVRRVEQGRDAERRVAEHGGEVLAVGVPVPRRGAFFELYPLTGVTAGLAALWPVVAVSTVGAGLVGAGVGRSTGRRMMRPLDRVATAAAAIARGDLSARVDPEADPDLSEVADSFNRTAAALEQRVRADARFAGDVSHELRTPLTTMLNSMEIVQHRWADVPPVLWEPLGLLAGDLHRFRKLVVDLLDISRPESGDDGAAREPVLIGELVRRAADAAAGHAVTTVEPSARAVVLQGDERRLKRVVANLVENAQLHGGGCVRVGVGLRERSLCVEVDDQGPGVPEHLRERVFERFTRDGARDDAGVGLGLAIVACHVRWHGGEVTVGDAPGGGARFTVELPLAAGPAEAGPGSPELSRRASAGRAPRPPAGSSSRSRGPSPRSG